MAYTKLYSPERAYMEFDGDHCYSKYGMTLTAFEAKPPKRITTLINTVSGQIDVTDAISDVPKYTRRTIKASFACSSQDGDINEMVNTFVDAINGKYFEDLFSSVKSMSYKGRVTVEACPVTEDSGIVNIIVDAEPYVMLKSIRTVKLTFVNSTKTPKQVNLSADKYIGLGDRVTFIPSKLIYLKPVFSSTEEATEDEVSTSGKSYTFPNDNKTSQGAARYVEVRPRGWAGSGSTTMELKIITERKGGAL